MDLLVSIREVSLLHKDDIHAQIPEIPVPDLVLDRGRHVENKETGKTCSLLIWAVIYRVLRIAFGKKLRQTVDHMMQ